VRDSSSLTRRRSRSTPGELYERINRTKTETLATLESLKGNFAELRRQKGELARIIAEALTSDDLAALPRITEAAGRALTAQVADRG
jgi:hypothetical protein